MAGPGRLVRARKLHPPRRTQPNCGHCAQWQIKCHPSPGKYRKSSGPLTRLIPMPCSHHTLVRTPCRRDIPVDASVSIAVVGAASPVSRAWQWRPQSCLPREADAIACPEAAEDAPRKKTVEPLAHSVIHERPCNTRPPLGRGAVASLAPQVEAVIACPEAARGDKRVGWRRRWRPSPISPSDPSDGSRCLHTGRTGCSLPLNNQNHA